MVTIDVGNSILRDVNLSSGGFFIVGTGDEWNGFAEEDPIQDINVRTRVRGYNSVGNGAWSDSVDIYAGTG